MKEVYEEEMSKRLPPKKSLHMQTSIPYSSKKRSNPFRTGRMTSTFTYVGSSDGFGLMIWRFGDLAMS